MTAKCFWITGLPAAGKTTIATKLFELHENKNLKSVILDGDKLRKIFGHNKYDTVNRLIYGYSYSRLCKFLVSQNLNVIIGIGGLFHELQDWNHKNIPGYTEILIDVPIEELKKRDPKGLYKQYSEGDLENLFGGDLKPEFPKNPQVRLAWENGETAEDSFNKLRKFLNI